MTRARPQAVPSPPPEQPADPLADLRDPEPSDRYEETAPQDAQEAPQEPAGALVTQEDWDAARVLVIAAWHADTVATGFLHKGGRCGCHYLSGVALTAVLPIQHDADPEPEPIPED